MPDAEVVAWPRGMWPKGVSGNPSGLPRGTPKVSVSLMRILRTPVAESFPVHTRADELASILFQNAIAGDSRAIAEVCDRTEGRPSQALQVTATQLPTSEIIERLVRAFSEAGIEEEQTRRILLQLSAGDDD